MPDCEPTDDPCPKGDASNRDIHFRSIVNEAQDLASYLKHMVPVVLRASGWEQKGSSVGVCVGAQYKVCLRKHSFNFMWPAMRFCDRGLVGL